MVLLDCDALEGAELTVDSLAVGEVALSSSAKTKIAAPSILQINFNYNNFASLLRSKVSVILIYIVPCFHFTNRFKF